MANKQRLVEIERKGDTYHVRGVIPGLIPDGPLPEGRVILRPRRIPNLLHRYILSFRVLYEANKIALPRIYTVLRHQKGMRAKLRMVKTELLIAIEEGFASAENWHRMGMRQGNCWCSEGMGHKKNSG